MSWPYGVDPVEKGRDLPPVVTMSLRLVKVSSAVLTKKLPSSALVVESTSELVAIVTPCSTILAWRAEMMVCDLSVVGKTRPWSSILRGVPLSSKRR